MFKILLRNAKLAEEYLNALSKGMGWRFQIILNESKETTTLVSTGKRICRNDFANTHTQVYLKVRQHPQEFCSRHLCLKNFVAGGITAFPSPCVLH